MSPLRNLGRQPLRNLADFVYPPQCCICELLHDGGLPFICPRCLNGLDTSLASFCIECKFPLDPDDTACRQPAHSATISRVIALGDFDDYFRPLIHAFKYNGLLPVGRLLAERMAEKLSRDQHFGQLQLLVPVPLHSSRERQRGFNQSRYLVECLARLLDRQEDSRSLRRTKRTRDQTGLNMKQRIENMRGAFAVRAASHLTGKRVLLVDDVTTTGATALEAARCLRAAGVVDVVLAVVASPMNAPESESSV